MKFYTHFDVERFLMGKSSSWDQRWLDVDVYREEIIITIKNEISQEQHDDLLGHFHEWFGQRYDAGSRELWLDYPGRKIKIVIDTDDRDSRKIRTIPLFEYIQNMNEFDLPAEMPGVPVYAFHSFKGGVGRTLVLLAVVHSLSKTKNGIQRKPYHLLIVDGDLEAPGLTWLADGSDLNKSFSGNYDISFLDTLAMVHESNENYEEILQFISNKIQEHVIRFPVGDQEVEHYFLPVFRDATQLMSMPITPSHLVKINGRAWIIGDFLSRLGLELKVDAVLVDLRAGISEFSAPLLFDPRIRKFYVSSTSLQSVRGMEQLLKQIYRQPLDDKYPRPMIIINQVPDEIGQDTLNEITERLLTVYPKRTSDDPDQGNFLDQIADADNIAYLPFAPNLIHLEGLETIDTKLNNPDISRVIDRIISDKIQQKVVPKEKETHFEKLQEEFLGKLKSYAERMEFAERYPVTEFMRTTSLKNLARKYRQQFPNAVIMGAKGSGKTFAYMQLARCGTWEQFVREILKSEGVQTQSTYIMPVLRSANMDDHARDEIGKCLKRLTDEIDFRCPANLFVQLNDEIQQKLLQSGNASDNNAWTSEYPWKQFWKQLLVKSTGLPLNNLEELHEYLQKQNKRLLFIMDGLEDIFTNVSNNEVQKAAVKALIQGLLNEFRENPKSQIGLLIFIRRDLAMHAIEQNWGQFASLYKDYELHWNHEEALRLINWIACRVDTRFALEDGVEIEKASRERLENNLHALWGVKLGKADSKEATTANWVLAALSDLNEQLQARDVIRFLKYAAQFSLEQKGIYDDRYLMPTAIRRSIEPCSQDKIADLNKEMPEIKRIFEILSSNKEKRQLPFKAEDYNLTIRDIKLLDEQGFLIETDDGYYMPEIIRRGLGFQIPVGARPKVLALLKAAKRRR